MSNKRKIEIIDLSYEDILECLHSWGEPEFRAKQLWEWLHHKYAFSFDEMTNLSKPLRDQLRDSFALSSPREISRESSSDSTLKLLLSYPDGISVECVGMPYKDRYTACLSTQAGCPMGCVFCATGNGGYARNLTADEIVRQAKYIERISGTTLSSVVLMGQGEPFLNYDNTLEAMRILNDPSAFNIGARHLTVSTSGILPGIAKLAHVKEQFNLAISLHSAIQETRNKLMPGVKKYTLPHLYDALQAYTEATKRRPTYEYLMIDGVNDTPAELDALVGFCANTLCHVNLIPFNAVAHASFMPSSEERIRHFQKVLRGAGVETTVRRSRGKDISAACGQLSQKALKDAT